MEYAGPGWRSPPGDPEGRAVREMGRGRKGHAPSHGAVDGGRAALWSASHEPDRLLQRRTHTLPWRPPSPRIPAAGTTVTTGPGGGQALTPARARHFAAQLVRQASFSALLPSEGSSNVPET